VNKYRKQQVLKGQSHQNSILKLFHFPICLWALTKTVQLFFHILVIAEIIDYKVSLSVCWTPLS